MRIKTLSRVSLGLLLLLSTPIQAQQTDLRLVNAVRHENRAAVHVLLQEQIDVNIRQPDGATALHWAAYLDDLETADLLLGAGALAYVTN